MSDTKAVRFIMKTIYEMEVPSDWDDDMCLFHVNEGSCCVSNAFNDLVNKEDDCGCGSTVFEISTPEKEVAIFGYKIIKD